MSGTTADVDVTVTAPAPSPAAARTDISGDAQWLRRVQLTLTDDNNQQLDLSELRVSFAVRQSDAQTPNTLDVVVYNPAEETARKVQREFRRVKLQAGYKGHVATIFDGSIIQARYGRDNATDTYLNIRAADGDQAYNSSTISVTLAAGATAADILAAVMRALAPFGVTAGYIAPMPGISLPRARTFDGMTRDVLRRISQEMGTSWSIQGSRLTVVPLTGQALPDDPIILDAGSGLIGMPEQTLDGIQARALLNPKIKACGTVRINNKSIQEGRYNLAYLGEVQNNYLRTNVRITDDGLYRVIVADHFGDTHGNPWYTDIICVALGDPITMAQGNRGRI